MCIPESNIRLPRSCQMQVAAAMGCEHRPKIGKVCVSVVITTTFVETDWWLVDYDGNSTVSRTVWLMPDPSLPNMRVLESL